MAMNASDNHSSSNDSYDYIKGEEEEKLIAKELEHIRKQHPDADKSNLFGLAFSGGGIRSATFCLGVMQALAEKGWLQKFHYLSTVSGGSYIGSSFTWLLHKVWKVDDNNTLLFDTDSNFPYKRFNDQPKAASKTDEERKKLAQSKLLLRYLRQHGKYLTPGGGITATSLLAVILRGTLLSLLVFGVPLVVILSTLVYFGMLKLGLNLFLWVAGTMAAALAIINIVYGLLTCRKRGAAKAYSFRRLYDQWAGKLLWVAGLCVVIGSLPSVANMLDVQFSSSMTLGGVITSVFAIMKSQNKDQQKIPLGLLGPLAAILLVYGVLLLSYLSGVSLACIFDRWMKGEGDQVILTIMIIATVISFLLSHFTNINHISIHRYYRDRLMELFMPNAEKLFNGKHIDKADLANKAKLGDMCQFSDSTSTEKNKIVGPYHIINTNMVTLDSSYMKLRARGGDNFILSPLYCGNAVTGWRGTKEYMGGDMSLATAMAISGAAADPHGAPGGEGLTCNWSISLLMALFNVRLGYWAVNPNPERNKCSFCFPNWFMQGWRELTGRGMDEKSRFVHLADGGHFENLALYELIRRRVKTIVVCDGAADPDYTFVDFANFVEKVRVDFGANVDMPSFLKMCPAPAFDEHGNKINPYAVDTAEQGYLIGKITYDNGSEGTLIYIKTTITEGLPKDIYGYKSGHSDFPDETTADQFFDEKQFEAYRELGYQLGCRLEGDPYVREKFEGRDALGVSCSCCE
jgi:hypothetical protein